MTNAERQAAQADARKKFFSWQPPGDPEIWYKCHKIRSEPRMTEGMCQTRASKPELYGEICGGNPKCPRWKHYRKMFKKGQGHKEPTRRAYK
jgi:hypothetical protein